MLHITIPAREFWDEEKGMFFWKKEQHLTMEHSLIALSKWESIYEKPFLTQKELTFEEKIDYFRCMTITPDPANVDYMSLTVNNIDEIQKYMNRKMSATNIYVNGKRNTKSGGTIKTSEDFYYLMTVYNIPFECEKWHLNRLIMLLEVCQVRSNPKKMSKEEVLAQNRKLNQARRAKYRRKR